MSTTATADTAEGILDVKAVHATALTANTLYVGTVKLPRPRRVQSIPIIEASWLR